MKLKKLILMSTSIVGMGLVIPTAIRVNQSNNNHSITKLRHSNNSVLSKVAKNYQANLINCSSYIYRDKLWRYI